MKFWTTLALAGSLLSVHGKGFDLILRNGRIADGTANPSFLGDIGVADGRITAIGKIQGEGAKELDITGMVVAP
ncbi:MAG: hypothetical protein ABIQ35_00425, partial [Verrucomicrobiota bacterium]